MDAAPPASSLLQDVSSAPAVAEQAAESSPPASFVGPRPEPPRTGGRLGASAAGGGAAAGGTNNDGHEEKNSRKESQDGAAKDEITADGKEKEDGDDEGDMMMADLANVDVHIALHDMDDSDSDGGKNDDNPSKLMVDTEATARAPSLVNGWDDNAAISCFDRAIRMHSMTAEELADEMANDSGWEAGPNVLPLAMSAENGAASTSAENQETASNQPMIHVDNVEVVTTSISDHFGENDDNGMEQNEKKPWRPRPLPLPAWAVDPTYAAAHLSKLSSARGGAPGT